MNFRLFEQKKDAQVTIFCKIYLKPFIAIFTLT